MAENLTIDFLHHYRPGDVRRSDPIAYQYDLGRILVMNIPSTVNNAEIHYWMNGMDQSQAYIPIITAADTGCVITANVPNVYFEKPGELRIYVVVTDDAQDVTTYEGAVTIRSRPEPDDYVDDNPENDAVSYVQQAKAFSEDAEAWAKGTRAGADVESGADQYHNNSKYYTQQAQQALQDAQRAKWQAKVADSLESFQVAGVDATHDEMLRKVEEQSAVNQARLEMALDSVDTVGMQIEEDAQSIQANELVKQMKLEMGLIAPEPIAADPIASPVADPIAESAKTIGKKVGEFDV